MATLLAARRQHLAPTFSFHTRAEAMRLMATAHFGLKGAFGQTNAPLCPPLRTSETCSLLDPWKRVKQSRGCYTSYAKVPHHHIVI